MPIKKQYALFEVVEYRNFIVLEYTLHKVCPCPKKKKKKKIKCLSLNMDSLQNFLHMTLVASLAELNKIFIAYAVFFE